MTNLKVTLFPLLEIGKSELPYIDDIVFKNYSRATIFTDSYSLNHEKQKHTLINEMSYILEDKHAIRKADLSIQNI